MMHATVTSRPSIVAGLATLFTMLWPCGARAQSPVATEPPWEARKSGFLVDGAPLFEALHADPRWPHFSASYQYFADDAVLRQASALSLGESLSVYRDADHVDQWELGLQAGVFAIFDLDAPSWDLVNADYRIGPTLAYRRDSFSAQLRLYHESSHLGDEFVLRRSLTRVNLSYEVVDVLLSVDVSDELRLYAGGGRILHSEPDLMEWMTQAGVEYGSSSLRGGVRPVASLDMQAREVNDWQVDYSARAGIELSDVMPGNRRLQILLEYYNGRSPNGQFYVSDAEFFGLGLHLYF